MDRIIQILIKNHVFFVFIILMIIAFNFVMKHNLIVESSLSKISLELSGFIFIPFAECKEKRDKIDNEIKSLFINSQRQVTGDIEHFLDKNSFTNNIAYWTSETKNEYISLTCYDWSEQSGYKDQLRIEAYSDEYYSWLSKL